MLGTWGLWPSKHAATNAKHANVKPVEGSPLLFFIARVYSVAAEEHTLSQYSMLASSQKGCVNNEIPWAGLDKMRKFRASLT